jgi:hypothetical protein
LSCSQYPSGVVKDPTTGCRSNISEDPALVTAHDLLVFLLACRTGRFSYNIGMRMNGSIRMIKSPILIVRVKNDRWDFLSRMKCVLELTQGESYGLRERTFLLTHVSYFETR